MAEVPKDVLYASGQKADQIMEGFAFWLQSEMRRWIFEIDEQYLINKVEQMGIEFQLRDGRHGWDWHISHHKFLVEYAMEKLYDKLEADEISQEGTAEERAAMGREVSSVSSSARSPAVYRPMDDVHVSR